MSSDKDDFVYDALKERHYREIERRKELDDKADRLIQCVTIVTGITIALGTTSFTDALNSSKLYITYLSGIGFLIISVAIALASSQIMKWRESPDLRSMIKGLGSPVVDINKMKENSIFELKTAIEHNFKKNQRKALLVIFSWGFMLTGLATLVIFLGMLVSNATNAVK